MHAQRAPKVLRMSSLATQLTADLAEVNTDIAALRAALADAADAKGSSQAFGTTAHTNQDVDALNIQIRALRAERLRITTELAQINGEYIGQTALGVSY